MFEYEPPLFGRPELNPWHPAFDNRLAADLAEREEVDEGQDEGGIPRRRVQRGIPPAHGPVLDIRLMPVVRELAAELAAETAGRDRFQAAAPADLYHAAGTFVRYRLASLDIIRHADRDARRAFRSDLWELGRRSSPQMQRVVQLMAHFTPHIMKSRANANDPMCGELVIPERLRNFAADLSPMGASLKPNQLATNYVSRELGRAKCQTPSYTPYIVADFSAPPWPVPSADRATAMAKWNSNNQAPKPGARPRSFHTWAMYRLRFIITADLCDAWLPFGGLSAQLNNLSTLLHLATVESISVALAHDTILSAHLEELARARDNETAGAVDFTDLFPRRKSFQDPRHISGG